MKIVRLPVMVEFGSRPIFKGLKKNVINIYPDVIHCHDILSFLPIQLHYICKSNGIPLILDTHAASFNTDIKTGVRPMLYRLFKLLFRRTLINAVYKFVPVGENERDLMNDVLDLPEEKIQLIRLPVNHTEINRCDSSLEYQHIVDAAVRNKIIIHAGKIFRRKKIDILIRAVSLLKQKGFLIKIIIAGEVDLDEQKYLDTVIRNNSLLDDVFFLGLVSNEQISQLFQISDIGVWPSGISVAAIEAMLTGMPLIVKDDEYNRFLVNNKENVYREGDFIGLAEKIEELFLKDSSELDIVHKENKTWIENNFSCNTVNDQFINLYLDAIKHNRKLRQN